MKREDGKLLSAFCVAHFIEFVFLYLTSESFMI